MTGIQPERTGPESRRASEIPFTGGIKSPEIYPRLAEPKHSAGYVSVDETRAQQTDSCAEREGGGSVAENEEETIKDGAKKNAETAAHVCDHL